MQSETGIAKIWRQTIKGDLVRFESARVIGDRRRPTARHLEQIDPVGETIAAVEELDLEWQALIPPESLVRAVPNGAIGVVAGVGKTVGKAGERRDEGALGPRPGETGHRVDIEARRADGG